MRLWIDCIFQNSQAHADFLTYLVEIETELTKRTQKLLLEGESQKATLCALELNAYQQIGQKFKRESQEHITQVNHLERSK